ncbi:MAG: hypothetical protein H7245_11830 [Candidatus Saccharibacteria bacterium]|nr:hypothetical protein [Pseudorhodobacter sp.]
MTGFIVRSPVKAWIGGVALALFVRAMLAFCLVCLFDMALGSPDQLLQLLIPALYIVSLADVTLALCDCLWAKRWAASLKRAQAEIEKGLFDPAADGIA